MQMQHDNENGYMIVVVIMILSVLSVIATAGTNNSITERRSATNEQIYQVTFYAADTGRTFVAQNADLYHEDNITVGQSLAFPEKDNPSAQYLLGSQESFNGKVVYRGSTVPPRGSGFEVGKFKAHLYGLTSKGFGRSE
ncbi:MAG: pilus assembly PilX N-terminal domain-containing protein, partial [Desulfobacterales bacterium]|nr:pilus assembly PilX N-terminal domain-containing protein [Desulfobacterales bacterium]